MVDVLASFLLKDLIHIILAYTGPLHPYVVKLDSPPHNRQGHTYPYWIRIQIPSFDQVYLVDDPSCTPFPSADAVSDLLISPVAPVQRFFRRIPPEIQQHVNDPLVAGRKCRRFHDQKICEHGTVYPLVMSIPHIETEFHHTSADGKLNSSLWIYTEAQQVWARVDVLLVLKSENRYLCSCRQILFQVSCLRKGSWSIAGDWSDMQQSAVVAFTVPASPTTHSLYVARLDGLVESIPQWRVANLEKTTGMMFPIPQDLILNGLLLGVSAELDVACVLVNAREKASLIMHPLAAVSGTPVLS